VGRSPGVGGLHVSHPARERLCEGGEGRLSQRILDDGKKFWMLFADLGNATSNSMYQRNGYTSVADAADMEFEDHAAGRQGWAAPQARRLA